MRGSFGRGFCDPTSVRSLESAKRWSEWQDLNLRPRVPKEVRYQGFSLELVGPSAVVSRLSSPTTPASSACLRDAIEQKPQPTVTPEEGTKGNR